MFLPASLLRRHVLESNRIEGISMRGGALFTSHLRAAAMVGRGSLIHPLEIHRTLCRHTAMESFGGTYRTESVWVGSRRMPEHERVPELMEWIEGLIKQLDQSPRKEIAEGALLIHDLFLHIHPFLDGNGRTARLFLNSLRLTHGLPWKVIEFRNRGRYYAHIRRTEHVFREHFPDVYESNARIEPQRG